MFAFIINLAVLLFGVSFAINRETPVFSESYSVKGILHVPRTDIHEPFENWYDESSGSSRIDHYGGMDKVFQFSNRGPFGTSFKIVPVSTETTKNVMTCFKRTGTVHGIITAEKMIPSTSGFKYCDDEMKTCNYCEKWCMEQEEDNTVIMYKLWIHHLETESSERREPIPVKYEVKKFFKVNQTYEDLYIMEYDSFSYKTPSADVFKLPETMKCEEINDKYKHAHVYEFNPMREFTQNFDDHVENAFNHFRKLYNRSYKDEEQLRKRKEYFRQNMRFIHSQNRQNLGYKLEMNHMTDYSDSEIKALNGRRKLKLHSSFTSSSSIFSNATKERLPATFDWRLKGAVNPVKDQLDCGSCWSFGAVESIEGAYFVKYNHLPKLSTQVLIDCSWGFGNYGCDGGTVPQAYEWIKKHGLPTEQDYGQYLMQDGYCHNDNVTSSVNISGYVDVPPGSIEAMKIALVKQGPIVVAIDGERKSFAFYSSGIYYDPTCGNTEETLNHVIMVVGYGTINGNDYWIAKNSYSQYWGEEGYILISQKDNNCGVLTVPRYPIIV